MIGFRVDFVENVEVYIVIVMWCWLWFWKIECRSERVDGISMVLKKLSSVCVVMSSLVVGVNVVSVEIVVKFVVLMRSSL